MELKPKTIKRAIFDYAHRVYLLAEYEKQDIDSYMEKHRLDPDSETYKEYYSRSRLLQAIIKALDEYQTKLGLVDGRGAILISDRKEITLEQIREAQKYYEAIQADLSATETELTILLDRPVYACSSGQLEKDCYNKKLRQYERLIDIYREILKAIDKYNLRLFDD